MTDVPKRNQQLSVDVIRELGDRGYRVKEIAEITGLAPTTIYAYASINKVYIPRFDYTKRKQLVLKLEALVNERIDREAFKRNVRKVDLIREILANIVHDNLFEAVLGD